MTDIDPESKLYAVVFKEKDKRKNKRDDKMEILRQVIGLRDTNNILDLVKEAQRTRHSIHKDNKNIAKDHQTIVDINRYDIPNIHIKLTPEQAAALRRHEDVRYVYEPGYSKADADTVPWGIARVQANSLNLATRHNGYGVKVAVCDTGINFNHADLKPNYKGGASFVPGVSSPLDDNSGVITSGGVTGPEYHGTHCSGTVCAAINNVDVIGVAPTAWLYAVKVLPGAGSAPNTQIAEGMVWADENDMDVLSLSLGGTGFDPTEVNAVNSCIANNRFVTAAAGNEGIKELHYPAAIPGVWSVGAVDQTDTIASFSSWGSPTDFVAPGVGIISDLGGPVTSGTHPLDGTSQATPHIAGLAAIAYANYRFSPCDTQTYPPAQSKLVHIAGAMIASCDTLGQTSIGVASEKYGFGMPQALKLTQILTGTS
jgi:subtilisin